MTQPTLFEMGTPDMRPRFGGATFDPALDEVRLTGLLERVREAMANGAWWTLAALVEKCGGSEAGVSARLRDLRKIRFGAHTIERRRCGSGLWEYRMVSNG